MSEYEKYEKILASDRPSQTKIVATVGPAIDDAEKLEHLIDEGVDVFRLNMAHGSQDSHLVTLNRIRSASEKANRPVAVLADLAGPKMRLGAVENDEIELQLGQKVRFVHGDISVARPSSEPVELTTTYDPLIDELSVGDRVLMVDGLVSVVVTEETEEYAECLVTQGGAIRTRQGVNLPGVKLSVTALADQDRSNAAWASKNGIDFLGLSFVRTASEVRELKHIIQENDGHAQVIAKIEKPEALENLEEIMSEAGGVMVARGDLGVETDIAEIAITQKRIIEAATRMHKPVICATQMLDSMQRNRLPTRAEVADVTGAILDGTDATMLSGETAIGDHPRETVAMMHRIALAAEESLRENTSCYARPTETSPVDFEKLTSEETDPVALATASAASTLAELVAAKVIIVSTASGKTALALSKNRNNIPVVGVSSHEETLRRMCLYWGVVPTYSPPASSPVELFERIVEFAKKQGALKKGDRVIVVTGTDIEKDIEGSRDHNAIVVHVVE